MKKSKKAILIFLVCLGLLSPFIWNYVVRNYPYEILSFRSYISDTPPITWRGITVDYKFGMHAVHHNSSITIHYWGREGEEGVGIYFRSKPGKDLLRERTKETGNFTEVSASYTKFKGNDVYVEEKIKNSNKMYMKLYHLLDFPIEFGYGGSSERMAAYEGVIDSISFSNATLQRDKTRP